MTSKLGQRLVAYEQGELDEQETIELFEELVQTGLAWQLKGQYGRTATALIEAGQIEPAPPTRRVDEEELMNQLVPRAWDLVEEDERYISRGRYTAEYAQAKHEMALRVLFDIASLPTTDPEDER